MSVKAERKFIPKASFENAKIRFRNFEGREGQYNVEGNRNFAVLLTDEQAEEMTAQGWNVKWLEPRTEDDPRQAYIKVKVKFDNVPPKIVMITSKGQAHLDEESVKALDWAEIENVDMTITPYPWEMKDKKGNVTKTGVTAYLKVMYVTIAEDAFEKKYRNVPDSAASALIEEGDDY